MALLDTQLLKEQWANTRCDKRMGTCVTDAPPLTWYIGYDDEMLECLMLLCHERYRIFQSTQYVKCQLFPPRTQEGLWQYNFSLLDQNYTDVFLDMCADIINYAATGTDEAVAFRLLEKRFGQWSSLFRQGRDDLLSKEQQRGLFGELLFLREQLKAQSVDEVDQIKAWRGPDGNVHDFIYAEKWCEIKTVMQGRGTVVITSLEQLDTTSYGELIVYALTQAPTETHGALTLNQLVDEIKALLQVNGEAVNLFIDKLLQLGYMRREEYSVDAWLASKRLAYAVREDFPGLTNVPEAVVKAKYELSLEALTAWRLSEEIEHEA